MNDTYKSYVLCEAKPFNSTYRDKEIISGWQFFRLTSSGPLQIADIRVYCSRNGMTFYSCVWLHKWVHVKRGWGCAGVLSGSGKAGGYGYDKESAAVYAAFCHAGFKILPSFSCTGMHDCGETAIRAFLCDYFGIPATDIFMVKFYA